MKKFGINVDDKPPHGSPLRHLRSTKVAGKARDRADASPSYNRGGKRKASSHKKDVIDKVLYKLKSGALDRNLLFSMGSASDVVNPICSLNNEINANEFSYWNDGLFIKIPCNKSPSSYKYSSPIAKSFGLNTSHDHISMSDVGNTGVGIASSKDRIAIVETGILSNREKVGQEIVFEHTSIEDVVSTGVAQDNSQDGIASYKGGRGFVFGKRKNTDSILNKPVGPFLVFSLFSAEVDRFAKKLKQGTEELALKMEYVPSSVSFYEAGNYYRNVHQNNVISRTISNQDKLKGDVVKRNNVFRVQMKKFGINVDDKTPHVDVESDDEGIAGNMKPEFEFFFSFVYAAIHTVDRRSLWKSLHKHKLTVKDKLWVILGDFNAFLDTAERSFGRSKVATTMNDFRDCVSQIEVEYIAKSGLRFKWNKKSGVVRGLLKKLDRFLGNSSFEASFPTSYTLFLPFMLSDHTLAVFVIPEVVKSKPRPFKFHNYLSSKDEFIPIVRNIWSNKVNGVSMFSLVSKLKMLKKPLRKLN
nr:hypothetical protein [Tanacetum cinerariifolium]